MAPRGWDWRSWIDLGEVGPGCRGRRSGPVYFATKTYQFGMYGWIHHLGIEVLCSDGCSLLREQCKIKMKVAIRTKRL